MRFRRLRRIALVLLAFAVVVACAIACSGWTAFGARADGERLARMKASRQYGSGRFENPDPMFNDFTGSLTTFLDASDHLDPTEPLPVVRTDKALFDTPPASGLRVTWLGHSAILLEIDGVRVLFDPVFGGRASPFTWVGPKAWYEPPLSIDELPPLDAILVSHDHHDHLQHSAMAHLIKNNATTTTQFIVPLGVGAHLEYWGLARDRITELDWHEHTKIGDVTIVSTPSRHASGRQVFDQMATLWTSYAVKGPAHRVFFSGDTGLFAGMKKIGQEHGPFDVVMVEIGAYNAGWPDWHIGPEQALLAHEWLRGALFVPIHWGMWNLAAHGWTEPVERVAIEADKRGTVLAIPRPGESIEPATLPAAPSSGSKMLTARWWPKVPFQTAAEHPVVSTRVPGVSPEPDPRVVD